MAQLADLARPVVRAGTGFHRDDALLCFAMSSPMVVTSMDASLRDGLTPSPWHADAVGERPHHTVLAINGVILNAGFRAGSGRSRAPNRTAGVDPKRPVARWRSGRYD
jgi:hypothetical protein